MVAALAHSDSSGSEGEAALAAAVSALRVRTERCARAPPAPAPAPAALLAALQPAAPAPRLVAAYADTLRDASPRTAGAVTDEVPTDADAETRPR